MSPADNISRGVTKTRLHHGCIFATNALALPEVHAGMHRCVADIAMLCVHTKTCWATLGYLLSFFFCAHRTCKSIEQVNWPLLQSNTRVDNGTLPVPMWRRTTTGKERGFGDHQS